MRSDDSDLRAPESVEEAWVPAPRSTMPTWLTATLTLVGGMAFAAVVFLFLAALQPSNPDALKFEQSRHFKGPIEQQAPKKAPPPSEQKKPKPRPPKPEKKPPKKPVRKVVKKTISKPQPRQQAPRSVEAPQNLGNLGVLGSGSGGGLQLDVDINSAFEVAQAEVQQFEDYEAAQRRLQESSGALRDLDDKARRGAGGASQARDARVKTAPDPPYPPKARQAGQAGTVYVRLFISTEGRVENHKVEFVDPEGFGFEEAFVSTLPRWRFSAAKDDDGRPTGQWIDWQYQFKLNE